MVLYIKGAYGNYNFGDDLLLWCLHNTFQKFHNVDFYFFSEEDYFRKLAPGVKLINNSNFFSFYLHKRPYMILYGGGTQFASFDNDTQAKMNSNILKYLLNPKLGFVRLRTSMMLTLINRTRHTSAMGIGIGPFSTKNSESSSRKVIRNMEFVGVRDTLSCSYLKAWHCTGWDLYSDLTFLMKDSIANFVYNGHNCDSFDIGVILRDWKRTTDGGSYMQNIERLDSIFKRQRLKCRYIIFSVKDKESIAISRRLNRQILVWDPTCWKLADFITELSCHRLIITSRYHGAICASLFSIPFLSINIEPKLEMVSELFSMPCWSFPFGERDVEDHILDVLEHYDKYRGRVSTTVEDQSKKAVKMLTDFYRYLERCVKED